MRDIAWKEDHRPARGGWAPGGYFCACTKCGEDFVGDKLAFVCADCAYADLERWLNGEKLGEGQKE